MAKKTISLKDYSKIRNEFVAAAGVLPGQVVALDSAGKVALAGNTAVLHMVALEDELQGKGIDDAYSAADLVNVGTFREGDELYLQLADGETIAIGDPLGPIAGDLSNATTKCPFYALEAVTTSGALGRIKVVVAHGSVTVV